MVGLACWSAPPIPSETPPRPPPRLDPNRDYDIVTGLASRSPKTRRLKARDFRNVDMYDGAASPGAAESLDAATQALLIRRPASNLYCGPRPTEVMLDKLRSLGVKTIINLEDYHTYWGWGGWRMPAMSKRFGLHMVRQPISPVFWVSRDRIRQIVDLLSDPGRGPFYVHCLFGKERTNLVVALYRRIIEEMPRQAARQAMVDDGFRAALVPLLASQVDGLLAETGAPDEQAAPVPVT